MSSSRLTHTNQRITTLVVAALHRRTIQLSCRACPHYRLLDAVPVWWLFDRKRWDCALNDVPLRFFCSRCWYVDARKVRRPRLAIMSVQPEGEQFEYPPERIWKALVSRYRS